jgi:tetratricopeptide (TPR) repeat protein
MRNLALILLGILLAAPVARAQSAEALAAYRAGEYDRAIAATPAECAQTSAFLARTRLSQIMQKGRFPDQADLEAARADAQSALAFDPSHAEARLQLAVTLSLMTMSMSDYDIWSSGYGTRPRALAEAVIADAPDLYHAHGFLSVWHLEVIRRGGSAGAFWFKASLKEARRHYNEANTKGARDPGLHWQYARALAALDAKKHEDEILAALDLALAGDAQSTLDETLKARAARLKATLVRDGPAAAQTDARTLL